MNDTNSDLLAITNDFVVQFKAYMKERGISQRQVAKAAGLSEGRISQLFKSPNNFTLETLVRLVRGIGLKVAVVGHDANVEAPHIPGEVFRAAWEAQGKPRNGWDLAQSR